MPTVRSFIYVDEYKLYSFSSQLFQGLTEYVIESATQSRERQDRAPLKSPNARVVAEIAAEHGTTQEKRFLRDHAYNVFESEMRARNAIYEVGRTSQQDDFLTSRLVRVTGPAVFFDAVLVRKMMEQFNDLGESLTYVTNFAELQKAPQAAADAASSSTDRNRRAAIKGALREVTSAAALAKQRGFHVDKKFLEHTAKLIEYGYGEDFQVQIPVDVGDAQTIFFSSVVKRSALRDDVASLIRKYARRTDRPVTVVGIVTQAGGQTAPAPDPTETPTTVKGALSNLVSLIGNFELAFTGRLENEVVLDPVAIYLEIDDGSPADGTTDADVA